jgi:hypothetical protein
MRSFAFGAPLARESVAYCYADKALWLLQGSDKRWQEV